MTKFGIFFCIFLTFTLATTMSEAMDCKTTSGRRPNETCVFPFTSQRGITYNSCTTDDTPPGYNAAWCATRVDGEGVALDDYWGNCEGKCQFGIPKFTLLDVYDKLDLRMGYELHQLNIRLEANVKTTNSKFETLNAQLGAMAGYLEQLGNGRK